MTVSLATVGDAGASGTRSQTARPSGLSATQLPKSTSYIVLLDDAPAIAYTGGVRGYPATAPARGSKFNSTTAASKKYAAYLTSKHDRLLNAVGAGGNKFYSYTWSLNGFAATLTPAQAQALAASAGVQSVQPDTLRQPMTDNSSSFLDMNDPGGIWEQAGGQGDAGEDIIVGVLDTGIWPEHPSFSDQTDLADRPGASGRASRAYTAPPSWWHGTCQSGELWSKDDCNNKLIGARYFLNGYSHFGVIKNDYKSARDADGHGTHTSSTAAGNAGVTAVILGNDLGMVSGMAPRARVATYKVCWNGEAGGCPSSDTAAAIDAAVADGVDVINMSLGSSAPSMLGPDDVALLFAADAGVFTAQSAGNDGPGASTIGTSSAPWITSVGAGTQDRTFAGSVELGNNDSYTGASLTGAVGPAPLVDSLAAGSELCIPGQLDPAVVAGTIVLCKRGVNARVEKSLAVLTAGGIGMILYNANANQETDTDNHYLPSVHISNADGLLVKGYIAGAAGAATASLTAGARAPAQGHVTAAFSSRGPNLAAADILKPDIMAPGVNILAGNTPTAFLGAPGQLFQSIGGTSMSSPHIAGIAAVLKDIHPDWSPAAIKSAMMTTATPAVTKEDGTTPADPFDVGSGYVQPNPAADPGLVYDAGFADYVEFLCGNGDLGPNSGTCADFGSIDPSDLNQPNITIGALAGTQTVTRTVTNVTDSAGIYTVSIDEPAGVDVVVDPTTFTLAAGASTTFEVTFTVNGAATLGQYAFGSMTWSDGTHDVTSRLVVQPVPLAAPGEAPLATGVAGELSYGITFGMSGAFTALGHGPVAATEYPGTVVDDPANDINTALVSGVGITIEEITIPAGTAHARFSLFDDAVDGATDDLDLYVFNSGGAQVGGSGSGTSEEEVNLDHPAAGLYYVVIHGWQTDGPDANYTLFSWALPVVDVPPTLLSASVVPATATLGGQATVTVSWTGLNLGTRYLGSVTYHNVVAPSGYDDSNIGTTIIRINA